MLEKIDLLPAVVELTQAQYDALSVYDKNISNSGGIIWL